MEQEITATLGARLNCRADIKDAAEGNTRWHLSETMLNRSGSRRCTMPEQDAAFGARDRALDRILGDFEQGCGIDISSTG